MVTATKKSILIDSVISTGVNSIITPQGRFRKSYVSQYNTEVNKLILQASETYTSNQIHTFGLLAVAGNNLKIVATGLSNNVNTIPVNQMCILDYSIAKFTITNNATTAQEVEVFMIPIPVTSSIVAYWGVADVPANIDATFVSGLGNNLTVTKNQSFTANPSATQYIWFACIGTSKFRSGQMEGGYALQGQVTVNGSTFNVYRSDWKGLGSTITTVTD